MNEKKLAIRRIILPCILVAFIAVFVGVLIKVQLIDGEEYAGAVNTATQSTVPIKAARGEIVDRNGKPIVVNRQGYSIIFDYSYFPSKKENNERNSIIISLIRLFEQSGVEWTNDLPIVIDASGGLVYKADSEKEIQVMKSKDMLNLNSYATAQNCYDAMVEEFGIDSSYSLRDGLKIAAVRYQMLLNGFGVSTPYTFAEDVDEVLVAKIKENSDTFKGVDVQVVPYRKIVDGTLAAHIIGTVGKISAEEYAELKDKGYGMNDVVGKSGIEYAMESYLRGEDGEKVISVDADGNVTETVTKEPKQGNTIVLTIDSDMQKIAQDTFESWTEAYAKSSKNEYGVPAAGALVVNDPNTGEILTILSYPTYDLNTYSENYSELSNDSRTPLWNRALRSTYAIGSTSKPSVAIAAIEEGLTNRDRVIRCTREFQYLDHTFYCNINHKDRNLTLRTALQDSCNIYFYTCGEELGVSKLNEYRSMLGLGVKTGIELTEAEGIQDSPEYRESIGQTWQPGYLILSSIGEGGTRFTPIQLANYVATIANGGTRYEQHLIKSIKSADYSETILEKTPKVALETGISKYAIDCVTEGMEYVVNNNNIIQSALKGLDVQTAAKTGTSEENRTINGVSHVINNGLYITFAPSRDAEIAIAMICEGVYGSSSLAQIAKPIYEYYFNSSQTAAGPQSENTLLG
ncbi:MAG: penicillin-binding transpeptidase domain-containing protein [Acutalibacteraceae bacterium]